MSYNSDPKWSTTIHINEDSHPLSQNTTPSQDQYNEIYNVKDRDKHHANYDPNIYYINKDLEITSYLAQSRSSVDSIAPRPKSIAEKNSLNDNLPHMFDIFNPDALTSTDTSSIKTTKEEENTRIILTIIGYLITITILLDGMFLNSEWFVNINTLDESAENKSFSFLHILIFVFLILSTISFILRCINFDVFLTTFACISFMILNGIVGLFSLLGTWLFYYLRTPDLKITQDFIGLIYAFFLALIIAALLIYDMKSTPEFRKKGSGMSRSQMKMLSSLLAVYSWSLVESVVLMVALNRPFYEGVYISFVTITTIGFGDLYPQTTFTKIFTSFWFIIGIFLATIYLLYTREVIVQMMTRNYEKKIKEIEKIEEELDRNANLQHNMERLQSKRKRTIKYTFNRLYWNIFMSRKNKQKLKTPKWARKQTEYHDPEQNKAIEDKVNTILEFNRDHSYKATAKRMDARLLFIFSICMIMYFFVATIFYIIERDHWVYGDAIWFCFVAFTTIGYGDTVLKNKLSLVIFNFVILIAVSVFTALIGLAVDRFQFFMDHVMDSDKRKVDFYPDRILGKIISNIKPGSPGKNKKGRNRTKNKDKGKAKGKGKDKKNSSDTDLRVVTRHNIVPNGSLARLDHYEANNTGSSLRLPWDHNKTKSIRKRINSRASDSSSFRASPSNK